MANGATEIGKDNIQIVQGASIEESKGEMWVKIAWKNVSADLDGNVDIRVIISQTGLKQHLVYSNPPLQPPLTPGVLSGSDILGMVGRMR